MRRLSNPYERVSHSTERTNNQKLVQWINEILDGKHIELGMAEQETSGADRKQPDVIIKRSPGSQEILCVIELKDPAFNPFDSEELLEPARKKATRRRAPYFATSNFRELIWFDTERANRMEPLEKQIIQSYTLSEVMDPDSIEDPNVRGSIVRGLERFLVDLFEISTGHRPEPRHAIDEILVYRIQNTVGSLAAHYKTMIAETIKKDKAFTKRLRSWFAVQQWTFTSSDNDFVRAARQTAYLLVNKILFYCAIQPVRRLDPLEIPKSLTSSGLLRTTLQGYFELVLNIDYQTIYSTDFIDEIAFPDNRDVVRTIKELIEVLGRYDFSKLGYDVIGRIFERLIPEKERHVLGQYFTRADVVDLILRFCLQHETDKVLDPSCGAGTFLVRAYQHKRLMNQMLSHDQILPTVWGNDIAKFPVHLTTINLAINDLRSNENFPRVVQKDFFDLLPDRVEFTLPRRWREVRLKGLDESEKVVEHPRYFDAIVGNPPYTRHDEIEDIGGEDCDYKNKLIRKALIDPSGRKLADIPSRSGVYAYFFVHGSKFLQNGGRFGFIVSNSWLDTDYGKGLQEHFLTNYKIAAIIESKVERWFEDAEVIPCIVLLEKCSGANLKASRDDNLVRFVYLKKPLQHFIPLAQSLWEKEVSRLEQIDKLLRTIAGHAGFYENDELRVYPKSQAELWGEGYDDTHKEYIGSKWGKYIRAPSVYFEVLAKAKDKLIPLRRVGEVNEGKPTGANEFFYVKRDVAKRYGIEGEFLSPGLMKPRGNNYLELLPKHLDRYFLSIDRPKSELKGAGALAYIKYGERLKLQMRDTFRKKTDWYRFGVRRPADLILPCGIGDRIYCSKNAAGAISSNSFTEIRLHDPECADAIWTFFNSALGWLMIELHGRTSLGGGMLKVDPTDIRKMDIVSPEYMKSPVLPAMKSVTERPVGQVSEESKAVDRRAIDEYVLGEVLGLSPEKQEEVRRAVVELVEARIARAKSSRTAKKSKDGVDLEMFAENIIERLGKADIVAFYRERLGAISCKRVRLPYHAEQGVSIENTLLGWRIKVGKKTLDLGGEEEARILLPFALMGWDSAPVPLERKGLRILARDWERTFAKTRQVLSEHAASVLQPRLRHRLERVFWAKLRERMEQE